MFDGIVCHAAEHPINDVEAHHKQAVPCVSEVLVPQLGSHTRYKLFHKQFLRQGQAVKCVLSPQHSTALKCGFVLHEDSLE